MNAMVEKFATLWPEITLLIGAVVCLITGLSPSLQVRKATAWVAAAALVIAGLIVPYMEPTTSVLGLAGMTSFVKMAIACVGLVLLMVTAGVTNNLRQSKASDAARKFEPGNAIRGEFFAFFLISLAGAMLTAGADDLVWLFLALELTSLPTYVMVATSRDNIRAQESAVKYFFLGALSAAMFLYGFTLLYGATGLTDLAGIRTIALEQISLTGDVSPLMLMGLLMSVVGICFKIAAVPMHFYAADVYEGAATPVTAFLAFVPKTAGFAALIILLSVVGWPLDKTPSVGFDGGDALTYLLWGIAVLTMTVGNVLGLLQNNVKRVLAYSSVAHTGYILVGVLAGPALVTQNLVPGPLGDGLAAVLFYLVAYGLATVASFAVLGCLKAQGEEAQTFDDISGLVRKHPALAGIMLVSVLSLLGLPPLAGFVGKIYLFGPAYSHGFVYLVIIALINSAISAAYYLRIASVCFFGKPNEQLQVDTAPARVAGAAVAAIGAIVLGVAGAQLIDSAHDAISPAAGEVTQNAVEATTADAGF